MSAHGSSGGSPFVPRELRPDLASRYESEAPIAPGVSPEEMQARIAAVGGATATRIAWDQVFRAADHVSSTVLDCEAVLLDVSTSRYYSLNGTGAAIWAELAAGRTAADLLSFVSARRRVEHETAAAELAHFLARLQELGLTATGGDPSPTTAVYPVASEPYEQPVLTELGPLTELTHKSLKEQDKDQQKDDKDRLDKDQKDNKDGFDKNLQDKGSVDKDLKDQTDKPQKDNKDNKDGKDISDE